MTVAYDSNSNVDVLSVKLGEELSNLYYVYIKLGSNESLSCFMTHGEKNELERNFFLGNPISIIILGENLKQLYAVHLNTKNIQFIKSEKVRLD